MTLKITLKPHERIIIGGAVVSNGGRRNDFIVENNVPILRQKDIMSEIDANTAARRLYFTIQLMYIDEQNLITHHNAYWKLIGDLIEVAPRVLGLIDQISEHIVSSRYYQALKLARQLIDYEQEVLNRVHK